MKLSVNNTYHNDWVIFDGNYHQIHSTSPEYPFLKDAKFGLGVVTWDNIKPIPLTPKILKKIEGCQKCFRIDNFGEYKECYEVVFAIGLMIRHNSYYIDWIGGNTEVKYLHTLQQVIRLFTKKEIEIKW